MIFSNLSIYSNYPSNVNILDERNPGAGKTTDALQFSKEKIAAEECVIFIMSDYANLSRVELRLDNIQSLIFKGKTQKDTCARWEVYKSLYRYIRPPHECDECNSLSSCNYQNQFKRVNELKKSGKGFVIFTVKENLLSVLSLVSGLNPTIIIDDVPLSTVVFPSQPFPKNSLRRASKFVQQKLFFVLDSVINLLMEEKYEDAIQFVKEHPEEYKAELKEIKNLAYLDYLDISKRKKIPNLIFLESLINCIGIYDLDRYNQESFKIVSSFVAKLQKYRILYLNATPDEKDRQTMLKLGKFETIEGKADDNSHYLILQVTDSKYTKQTLQESQRIIMETNQICDIIQDSVRLINNEIVFMTHENVYNTRIDGKTISHLNLVKHVFVKFYGSDSKATNDFRSHQICIIAGTPYYPPEYFLCPSLSDINDLSDPDAAYPVSREISEDAARGLLIQMIGRICRENEENPDCLKVVIVFSRLHLSDTKFLPEIGARIERYKLSSNNPEDAFGHQAFYSRVKEIVSQAFEESIIAKACEIIDQRVSQYPSEDITLNGISEELTSACGGLLSRNKIGKHLEKIYKIEQRINSRNHRSSICIVGKI
ncbi:hypothetical protein [Methanosphaerula subterraneus]|uniref:hypothetical protein n=1 Tax=Methanosphaerula subterraneus TaxID=3350244 RepID=UPI003F87D8EA